MAARKRCLERCVVLHELEDEWLEEVELGLERGRLRQDRLHERCARAGAGGRRRERSRFALEPVAGATKGEAMSVRVGKRGPRRWRSLLDSATMSCQCALVSGEARRKWSAAVGTRAAAREPAFERSECWWAGGIDGKRNPFAQAD